MGWATWHPSTNIGYCFHKTQFPVLKLHIFWGELSSAHIKVKSLHCGQMNSLLPHPWCCHWLKKYKSEKSSPSKFATRLHYRVLKPLKMKRRLTICANKCAMGGLAHNEACGQKERYTLDRCSIGQVQVLYNAPIWMRTFSCVLNCGLESSCIVMQLGPYPVIDIVTTFDSTATGKHSAWHLHCCAMFELEMLM